MNIEQLPLGVQQTNCYLVTDQHRQGVIIDPGAQGGALVQRIKDQGWRPLAVILTHAHGDHIGALDDVVNAFSIPVYLHKKEVQVLKNPKLHLGPMMGIHPGVPEDLNPVKDGDVLSFGDLNFQVIHTPGHTPGSMSLLLDDVLFSGDTLFYSSIGRTDFPGGDVDKMKASLERLMTLPKETTVLSGHGNRTTIGFEKDQNPFVRGFGI